MDSSPRPTFTYLRFLEVEISQFLNTLQVHLSEEQWAILQLTCIASNLLAVVQALLFSGNETSE